MHLPPCRTLPETRALERALALVPARHREDVLQEAWLAHLEGRNPQSAIRAYVRSETRHEERERASADLTLAPPARSPQF